MHFRHAFKAKARRNSHSKAVEHDRWVLSQATGRDRSRQSKLRLCLEPVQTSSFICVKLKTTGEHPVVDFCNATLELTDHTTYVTK